MLETGDFSGCWILAKQPHGVHPAWNSPGWGLNISYIYTGLTQKNSKPVCSSAGEDDQVKCELCFHSWAFLVTSMVPQRYMIWMIHPEPKPTVPGLLSDATTVTLAWSAKTEAQSSHWVSWCSHMFISWGLWPTCLTISSLSQCLHILWQRRGCLAS